MELLPGRLCKFQIKSNNQLNFKTKKRTGEEPYPEKEILEVAFLVRDGYKLEIPQNCPEELGNLILKVFN